MLSSLNAVISTNERNWILTGHVIFKLRYNQIYQLKTTKNFEPIVGFLGNSVLTYRQSSFAK